MGYDVARLYRIQKATSFEELNILARGIRRRVLITAALYMFAIAAVLTLLAISGCDSRPNVSDRFPDGVSVICTDADGKQWAIKHHLGDNYTITEAK